MAKKIGHTYEKLEEKSNPAKLISSKQQYFSASWSFPQLQGLNLLPTQFLFSSVHHWIQRNQLPRSTVWSKILDKEHPPTLEKNWRVMIDQIASIIELFCHKRNVWSLQWSYSDPQDDRVLLLDSMKMFSIEFCIDVNFIFCIISF